jgi:glycosyltransferase involved in cell wall biosynthesis
VTREGSVLFVVSRDLSSPLGCTAPYYLIEGMADSREVHVIARKQSERRAEDSFPDGARRYEVDTGDVRVLSGLLFLFASTVLAVGLSVRHRYDAVYAFQNELLQGKLAAVAGGSRFVADLQSVPVRQGRDFTDSSETPTGVTERVSLALYSVYERVTGYLLDSADQVFCLTDGIRGVTEDCYGIDLSDATVVGMGIDPETFEVERTSRGDPWRLTYVGTVRTTRGLDHVLAALADADRDVELRIAGTGPDDHVAQLRRRAVDLGVDDQVEWLGLVPHDEVPELLAETDLALSPLRDIESYRISFPAKLLEYMAAGCPVLATDLPAHRRLVDDGENGFLYDGTPRGLLAAMDRAIEGDYDRVATAARETAEEYDWASIVEEHETATFA